MRDGGARAGESPMNAQAAGLRAGLGHVSSTPTSSQATTGGRKSTLPNGHFNNFKFDHGNFQVKTPSPAT